MNSRQSAIARIAFVSLLGLVGLGSAASADTEFRLVLDLDGSGTDCTVIPPLPDVPFTGVDQVVVTTVDTDVNPPLVTGVVRYLCTGGSLVADPTFTPIPPLTWPTGPGNGLTSPALDLVELYAPLPFPKTNTEIRWGIAASPAGSPINDPWTGDFMVVSNIAWGSIGEIPTLGEWGLALLALLLALGGVAIVRRKGSRGALVVLLLLTVGVGVAWAAIVRDGARGDWVSDPNVQHVGSDPANDGLVNAELVDASAIIESNVLNVAVDTDFILDDAPEVLSSSPADGATGVPLDSNITVTFSENVNITASTFLLNCPTSQPFTVSPVPPGGTNSYILDPTNPLPAGANCTVSIAASQVTDTDTNDPPDQMAANDSVSFGTNAPPTAVDDTAVVTEDDPATAVPVLTNDTDAESDAFTIASATDPANGTVVLTGGSPGAHTGLTYQPDPNYCNTPPGTTFDTFTYTLNPGGDTATVTMTVNCVDDPPTAVADTATVSEDSTPTAIDVLANDTDIDAGPKNVASVTDPANGTVVLTPAGPGPYSGLTYQPDPDYCNSVSGTPDTFSYTLTPGSSSTTVSVTVTCGDDPPVAVADTATVGEDSGANAIDVLANDTDIDAGPKNVASATDPANGTVVLTPVGPGPYTGLTYQPDADYCNSVSGTPDTFSYTLTPGSSSTTVSVTVTCADDPPVAVADTAVVGEDSGANAIDVLANDTDIDAGPKNVASATDPANGTVVLTPVGPGPYTGLTYQPDPNYCNSVSGTPDTFSYTLTPGSSSTTVSVTVTCIDDPPVAVADSATVNEDSGANVIDVLANDTDIDLGPKNVASATDPANGTVVLTPVGPGPYTGLTYQPDPNYCNSVSGTPDTFSYTLTPGSSSTTVSVTVTCINDVPALDLDADNSGGTLGNDYAITFNEGQTAQFIEDTADATITDLDNTTLTTLTVTLTNLLDSGFEVLNVDLTGANPAFSKNYDTTTDPSKGVLTITASPARPILEFVTLLRKVTYVNTDDDPTTTARIIQFVANDGTGNSNTATTTVTMVADDDPPVAVADSATVGEDSGATAINVLANDTDVDLGPKNIASATDPANGTVVLTPVGPGPYTGLTYQPDPNYCNSVSGTPDTFNYTLTPGSSSTTVSVTVTCSDDPPVAVADTATVGEDSGATAINVLANDTDVDAGPKNIASATDPANGTVVLTPVGPGPYTGLTYQPDPNYCNSVSGTPDTFNYTLTPGSSFTTVSVTVTCVDDPPVAVADSATVNEDSGANAIDVLANDTDIDAGPKNVASATDPANGTVVLTPVGPGPYTGLTYQPDPNYCNSVSGTPDTFNYTLTPGSSSTTVSVTVTCVDDPPVAVADTATVVEDSGANAINVLANDTDVDAGPKNIFSATDPTNGTVVLTPVGPGPYTGLTYQPDSNYCNSVSGTPDTFNYTLTPGSSFTTVSVTVTCVNDPPVANPDTADITEEAPNVAAANTVSGNVLTNDTDLDGPPLSVSAVAGGSVGSPRAGTYGSVTINSNGSFTYTLDDTNPTVNALAPGQMLTDPFGYTASDGSLTSSSTLTVTIHGADDPATPDDDAYDFIGNTQLLVQDNDTPGAPHVFVDGDNGIAPEDVLDGDIDPDGGPAITIFGIVGCGDLTAPFDCVLPGQGTVSLQADGSFSFVPEAGDADPTATFQYTLTGNPNPATVTLTRFERVWYVDPNAGGGGNGTSLLPFNSLTSLNGAGGAGDSDVAGDYIFIHDGTLAGSIEMENNEHLVGEGHVAVTSPSNFALSIPVNLNGNGSPTNLVATGTKPQVTNASGDTVKVTTQIPIEIVGLSLASTTGNAIDLTSTAALTGSGTLTISNDEFRGAGAEGIDVNLNSGTITPAGDLTIKIQNNSWNAAGTHTGNAVDVNRAAGTLRLDFSNNTNILSSATAVNIAGGAAANTFITGFANNTVHQSTGGSGIIVSNATFDSDLGTANLQTVSGGVTVIGASGDGVGGAGLVLNGTPGDLSFTDLDIFNNGGTGLGVAGTGSFTGAAGTRVTVGAGVGTIETIGGPAADLSSMTASLPINTLTSTNSATTGVSLVSVPGTFSAGSGSSITNATGTDFNINGSNATVTYNGTIADDVGQLVSIASTTGGTKSFTGAISDGPTANTGSGISLTSNTGATIRFSGGLALSTGGNPAFTATGPGPLATSGGTVEVCDENPCNPGATGLLVNTLTTTTGTALNVANTTISSNNLEFRSISAGTGASGPTNGILLNNTGSSGGLKVKGSGSAGSGGTIQNTTGDGISLTSTQSVSLDRMVVNSGDEDGIDGTSVNGFSLANSSVTSNGNVANEEGISFSNLSGAVSMTNVTATGNAYNNLRIDNTTGTISSLTISGSSFSNNLAGVGNHGALIEIRGTSQLTTASITGTTFSGNEVMGIQVTSNDTAVVSDFTISGCTITNNELGIDFSKSQMSSIQFKILNNTTFTGQNSHGINLFTAVGAGTTGNFQGRIQGNVIGNAGVAGSGSAIGNCIRVNINGDANADVLLDGNTLRQCPNGRGIEVIGRNGTGGLDLTVTNNDANPNDTSGFPLAGIFVQSNCATVCNSVRADVRGNTVPAGAAIGELLPTYIALVETGASTLQLVDTAPASPDCTGQLTSTNTGSASASAGCALIAGPINTPP